MGNARWSDTMITVVLFKTPQVGGGGADGEKSDSVPILFLASFHKQSQLLKTAFHWGFQITHQEYKVSPY